ncbi:phospholipase D/nuclease [Hypoxylon trugodes]|uniref:phospholipase D/nuclease n=1 Tax=Hypoxylon trugodes TaxID=326681 RepID=UPI0021962044|nr:phospholipase D/nuclease [Hypoxylon trugodes]KAI1386691.1 phospholipase D/nuclease [Hypoxylon trugodes]
MDHLFHKVEDAFKEVKDAIKHEEEERPHHESHNNNAGAEQSVFTSNNRFQSFAPETSGAVKWYVDGASYFYAVSLALEEARESVYILDWWLSPELYLRRPPSRNEQYRLDNMLRAAAERGVEIRVIVYKEVTQALTLDSAHTKHALEALHPNIKVFRHPDHLPTDRQKLESAFAGLSLESLKLDDFSLSKFSGDALKELYGSFGDTVLYWAHHEKLCVVDRRIAFMGGLDMCFGRYDTNSHPIADAHPGNLDAIVFPGQDFNNARVYDFEGVDNWDHNKLDRTKSSRMGWSDIAISLKGPIVGSLIDHFTDRWNFIFDDKYTKRDAGKYERIGFGGSTERSHEESHHGFFDDVQGHFNRGVRHLIGEGQEHQEHRDRGRDNFDRSGSVKIQLCRSCSEWSAGHPTEHSIANAYINAIENAQHFVYIENQFFITATSDEQKPVENKIGATIVSRIVRAHNNREDFQVIVLMPAVPAFAGDLKSDGALGTRAIMEFQYNSINRGGYSIIESLQKEGVDDWRRYIGFYNLRNYDRINISSTLHQVEQESGVSYESARREHDDRVGGYPYGNEGNEYGNEGNYERYQSAASNARDRTWDTVSSCYMDGGPDIRNVPWDGSPESELDAFVSEELYIHSKVLIADDRLVICGSANLNDRSQLGTHDSEIAVVIEDPEPVESTMNGQPFTASRFAASLRRQLWRKHLGLLPDQPWDRPNANWTPVGRDPQDYDWGSRADRLVEDPMSEDFRNLWTGTARTNTEVFTKVFHPVPNDHVRTWDQYEDFFSRYFVIPTGDDEKEKEKAEEERRNGKVDYGHVVRDEFPGGVAEVKDWLSRVRGTLVEMPLDFLVDVEDLAKSGLSLNAFTDEIYT